MGDAEASLLLGDTFRDIFLRYLKYIKHVLLTTLDTKLSVTYIEYS